MLTSVCTDPNSNPQYPNNRELARRPRARSPSRGLSTLSTRSESRLSGRFSLLSLAAPAGRFAVRSLAARSSLSRSVAVYGFTLYKIIS